MATRRARIKAVASLPVRRKYADNKPNAAPNSQDEIQPEPCESADSSMKRHIEQTSSLEHENVSVVMSSSRTNDYDPELSKMDKSTIRTLNQSITKTTLETILLANALNRPIADTNVQSIASENPLKIDICSSIQHNSNSKSPPNCVVKILSNNIVSTATHNIEKACSSESAETIDGRGEGGETGEAKGSVDGIMPLETARSRTVELLKSEIISETAEVLFDPIVPLPSHGKLRHKLRPSPRLALPSLRRNSVQGSASESEDDHKRVVHGTGTAATSAADGSSLGPAVRSGAGRVRHDSQSSLSTHQSQLLIVRDSGRSRNDSVCSEKHLLSRSRRSEITRTSAQRQKMRARGDALKRDQLTMYDLIFYNPTANPIVENKEKRRTGKKIEEEESEEEDAVALEDDGGGPEESSGGLEIGDGEPEECSEGPEDATPAPQIKLGPNGEILIDEKSLVIKQTTSRSRRLSASVVQENEWSRGGNGPGGRYNRAPRTKKWPDEETVRFYRALAAVGTDFSLMQPLFPDRTRKDIKAKFKKEERVNRAQVDKALTAHADFDLESLTKQFAHERLEAEERARRFEQEAREIERAERERVKRARDQGRAARSAVEITSRQKSLGVESKDIASFDSLAESCTSHKRKPPPHKDVTRKVATLPLRKPTPMPITPPRPNPLNKLSSATQSYDLPANVDPMSVAKDVAPGSLVCLTIPDPNNPSKKVLQTYVADGAGNMTPISLPHDMLSSVMDYMNSNAASEKESTQIQASLSSPTSNAVKRVNEDSACPDPPAAKLVRAVSGDSANEVGTVHHASLEPRPQLESVLPPSPSTIYTITNL